MRNPTPPKYFLHFFRWFCDPSLKKYIEGDLLELFVERVNEYGIMKARKAFAMDVIKLFRPSIIRDFKGKKLINKFSMYKNYLKISLRLIKSEKSYSLINISGLVIGLTCFLMITLFVRDELSYDTMHQDAERIYRLESAYMRQARWEPYASNSWKTGELIKTNYGEIEELVRIRNRQDIVTYQDKRFIENRVATVEDNFFKIFSFPLISGNRKEALTGSHKVVITESMAAKYFGQENPLGKVLDFNDGNFQLKVSGVMQDMPTNAHFHFDFLISGSTSRDIAPEQMFTNVGWDSQYIYVKLDEVADPVLLDSSFPEFINNNLAPFTSGNFKLSLQPLLDIHLHSNIGLEIEPNSKITHVYIFSIVALFVLIIACVNYMNLTTARSLRRAKEVGMRKVMGANRTSLIGQFLSESFLMSALAALMAMIITFLLLPEFNRFAGKEIHWSVLVDPQVLTLVFIALCFVGIFSGTYPAFVLSRFKPINSLKGGKSTERFGLIFRKGLVVFQFAISIGLIAATLIVSKQLNYLRNKDLGINEDLLVAVPLANMDRNQLDVFRETLYKNPHILTSGLSNMKMPGWISNSTPYTAQDVPVDEEARKSLKIIRIDYDFITTVESEIVNGRNFSRDYPSDLTESLVLNESAIRQIGWDDPVGRWIDLYGQKFNVVGVVKDFHFESLHREIPPTIFILSEDWYNWAYIKITGENITETLEYIGEVYVDFVTNREFSYSFVDEDVKQQYAADEKFTEIFTIFTMLTIFIACLGTFGLISYSVQRKSKEIGVRKILGASVSQVTFLLVKEFIFLLLIASVVTWPITYLFIKDWIEDFVYRTNIGIESFVIASIVALLIAALTTGFRAMKAALANPVDAIKME